MTLATGSSEVQEDAGIAGGIPVLRVSEHAGTNCPTWRPRIDKFSGLGREGRGGICSIQCPQHRKLAT